jgi:hypothetical protein
MDNRDEALALELGKKVSFGTELPEMIFSEVDSARFFFFERPVFSYRELIRHICKKSCEIYQSTGFLTFGRPSDNWSRQYFETDSDDFAADIGNLCADFGAGELGYPIVLSNLALDWILYEDAMEDIAVMQIGISTKAEAFIAAVAELDPIRCEDMTPESSRYPVLRECSGALIDLLQRNYCNRESIRSEPATPCRQLGSERNGDIGD